MAYREGTISKCRHCGTLVRYQFSSLFAGKTGYYSSPPGYPKGYGWVDDLPKNQFAGWGRCDKGNGDHHIGCTESDIVQEILARYEEAL